MPTLAGYLRKNRLTHGTVTASCRASYYPPGCASVYPVSLLRPTDRFPSKTGFTLVTACFQLAGHITRDVGRASQRHAARASSKSRHGNGPAPPIHPSVHPSAHGFQPGAMPQRHRDHHQLHYQLHPLWGRKSIACCAALMMLCMRARTRKCP